MSTGKPGGTLRRLHTGRESSTVDNDSDERRGAVPHKKNRTQCCYDDMDRSMCDELTEGGLSRFCCGCGRLYQAPSKTTREEHNTA